MCLKVENVAWLDSLNYLEMPLRKLTETFGLTAEKSWYPISLTRLRTRNMWAPLQTFHTMTSTRCASRRGRSFFFLRYETIAKNKVFDNRRVLES